MLPAVQCGKAAVQKAMQAATVQGGRPARLPHTSEHDCAGRGGAALAAVPLLDLSNAL